MTEGFRLKTRLTFWSLLVLAFMLGGGGFFSFYAHYRQLHRNLDNELLSIRRNLDWLFGQLEPTAGYEAEYCRLLSQYPQPLDRKITLSLFSSDGNPLCSTPHPLQPQRALSSAGREELLVGKSTFTTIVDDRDQSVRLLTVTAGQQAENLVYLQIGCALGAIEEKLEWFVLVLSLAAILTLAGFGLFLWRQIGILTTPLLAFTAHLEQTREDHLQPFSFPVSLAVELKKLFTSFNTLCQRMARSLQRSRQFSADVTHELRTPLTILKGETELALRNGKTKEQLLQALGSNLEEIFRMSHLIEDLLMLSKSELGEIPLKMRALNLSNMMLELFNHAQILAGEKMIGVEIQGAEEQISLFADEKRLRQVFLNLLSNAIKYTPEGGRVSIQCRREGEKAQVVIEDTGIGIDSQHQEFIFDRFYRIDKTRNRDDGGSGLGLAIAKWIVDAHKGSIKVVSTPGQGSRFVVQLPLTRFGSSSPGS